MFLHITHNFSYQICIEKTRLKCLLAFFSCFFLRETNFQYATTPTQAVVTFYYFFIIFLLPFNSNSLLMANLLLN